jgi:hypothetical protein
MRIQFRRRTSLLVIAAVVVLAIVVVAVAAGGGDNVKKAQACVGKADVGITADSLVANPDGSKDKCVKVVGKVFRAEKDGNTSALQVWTKPESSEGNVIIGYKDGPELKDGDFVEAEGLSTGEFKGENAFGAKLKVPTLVAGSIKKVERGAAVAPAKKTLAVNQTQDKGGFTATVEKVEFGDNETRVYVKVKNATAAKYNFYGFNAKMVQAGTQVKVKSVYDADKSTEIPSDVLPNTEEDGILLFEKANPDQPVTIILEAVNTTDYAAQTYEFTAQ